MLYVRIKIGKEGYVINTNRIVEIVPFAYLRVVPHAPAYLTGIFNYRGETIPVIDLCQMVYGRPSEDKISTRIIIVRIGDDRLMRRIGFLVEGVLDTKKYEEGKFSATGLNLANGEYLGRVINDDDIIMQELDLNSLVFAEAADVVLDEIN